ncbi:MAG: hypothetical protein HYY66_00975 [Candidatus Tectomicrobia bacterium]|nr:hypothetical protein [Candidatus Tectomicrobia bacterium]
MKSHRLGPWLRAALAPALLAGVLGAAGCGSISSPGGPSGPAAAAPQDEADYANAAREHTAQSYARYLEHHPAGAYARQAGHWAERLAYYDALSTRDPAVLQAFLRRFPQSGQAMGAQRSLQRAEYEKVKGEDTIPAYRAFLAQYGKQRSEWTAAATQRLERLLLDKVKEERREIDLSRFIHDNPGSPYLAEAREALRRAAFERVIRSKEEKDWTDFLRGHPGTPEAARVARHMEEEALRGAERSGRAAALERFLERYPASPHKERVQAALVLLHRGRGGQAARFVQVLDAEAEVYTPPKCDGCKPVLRVHGTLHNTDPDFSYDLTLEAELDEGGRKCCRTRHEEKALRPGERRPFVFGIPDKAPPASGRPPRFEVRVASGRAYEDKAASQRLAIPGLGTGEPAPPADTFRPEKVPPLR